MASSATGRGPQDRCLCHLSQNSDTITFLKREGGRRKNLAVNLRLNLPHAQLTEFSIVGEIKGNLQSTVQFQSSSILTVNYRAS